MPKNLAVANFNKKLDKDMPKLFIVGDRVIGVSRAIENQLGTVLGVIDDDRATRRYQIRLDNGRIESVTNRGINPAPIAPANIDHIDDIQAPQEIDDDIPGDNSTQTSNSSNNNPSPPTVSRQTHRIQR